jgi:hypothetical protein
MATVNITVENDADFYQVFQYATAAEPPVPISIVGGTLEMMLRRHAEDEAALLRLSTEMGEIALVDAAAGKFSIMIPAIELQRLALGEYVHSLILTLGGLKTKIWSGTFVNNAGPTR